MIKKEIEKIVDQQIGFEERMRELEKQVCKIDLEEMRKESHFMANIGEGEVKDRTDTLLSEAYHRLNPGGKYKPKDSDQENNEEQINNSSLSCSNSQSESGDSSFSKIILKRPSICEMLRSQEKNILDTDSPSHKQEKYIRILKQRNKELEEKDKELKESEEKILVHKERKWMINRGKEWLLDFKDSEIKKLKKCFNSLDADDGGSIGLEELEVPLIGLGFAENREEVKDIMNTVDEDGNGDIEFPEFLSIIKNSVKDEKLHKIYEFFKKITTGTLGKEDEEEDVYDDYAKQLIKEAEVYYESNKNKQENHSDIPFNLLVQKIRRKYMLQGLAAKDIEKKEKGLRILKNVANLIKISNNN